MMRGYLLALRIWHSWNYVLHQSDWESNNIGAGGSYYLCQGLYNVIHLTISIRLCYSGKNRIGNEGALQLHRLSKIQFLDVAENHIGRMGIQSLFLASESVNLSIQCWDAVIGLPYSINLLDISRGLEPFVYRFLRSQEQQMGVRWWFVLWYLQLSHTRRIK